MIDLETIRSESNSITAEDTAGIYRDSSSRRVVIVSGLEAVCERTIVRAGGSKGSLTFEMIAVIVAVTAMLDSSSSPVVEDN